MRITQGYLSKSISDFPFHQIYSLDDYKDQKIPSVFFGMYRFEDYCLLMAHDSVEICFLTGQDVLQWSEEELKIIGWCSNIVTAHPKVRDYIISKGHYCELVPPSTFLNSIAPQKLGPKIYAYCPNSAQDYHGKKVIDELRTAGYEIIIGDGQWTQNQWRTEKADFFYNDIFIGLCLSEFAGGGTSIIEMGLRGIKVITNVFDLPNCIPWKDAHDISGLIERQRSNIGYTNAKLATDVWHSLDHEFKWLEI